MVGVEVQGCCWSVGLLGNLRNDVRWSFCCRIDRKEHHNLRTGSRIVRLQVRSWLDRRIPDQVSRYCRCLGKENTITRQCFLDDVKPTLRSNSVISVPILSRHRLWSVTRVQTMRSINARWSHCAGMRVGEGLEIHRLGRIHFFAETQKMECCVGANFIIHTFKLTMKQ